MVILGMVYYRFNHIIYTVICIIIHFWKKGHAIGYNGTEPITSQLVVSNIVR